MSIAADIPSPALPASPAPLRARRFSMLFALLVLIPIGVFNRYIFDDENLPIFCGLMLLSGLLVTQAKFPLRLFPTITFTLLAFTLYAWSQLDDPTALDFETGARVISGFAHVVDLGMFYVIFVAAALAYAKSGRLSRPLWFLICGYLVAYMLRNSVDIGALQQGYNLSPGFVIFSLLGFTFLGPKMDKPHRLPLALTVACMFWLALIGARSATGTILIFLILLAMWPFFTRNRALYWLAFAGMWFAVVGFHVLYFTFATNSADPLVAGATFGIFEKRIGTRIDIWVHLAYLISQSPWVGYGTDAATLNVAPLMMLEFTFDRSNLGSHSLYLELLYRLGIVGLAGFALVVAGIWKFYWIGRNDWATRVAGSFLASALVFGTTSEYLVFGTMRLENGFAWAMLGVGAGACLRRRRLENRAARMQVPAP